jgi:hypothetical protein
LKGLKAFKQDYPNSKSLFLYRGNDKLMIDGILCIPCDVFLKNIIPGNELVG